MSMQSMFMAKIRQEILFRFSKHGNFTSSNKLKLWYSWLFAVRFHFQERFVPSCDLVMQCVSVAGSLFCHYPRTGVSTSRRKWGLACCTSSFSSSSSTSGKWGLACCCCSLNYAVITSSTPLSLSPCNQCNFVVCSMPPCTHTQRQLVCWKLKLVSAKWHLAHVKAVVLVLILSWGSFPEPFIFSHIQVALLSQCPDGPRHLPNSVFSFLNWSKNFTDGSNN